ncbi:hypothetical protein A3A95_02030 [Candidatus Nomurabacteria bacterium RIFCSPLOWO2_01_FULL_39_18]|uniref:Glycosyl hydrolase family 32 N-terminal domain-containing protein n=1 Tax=Candidatus Nomurabacteria bacterium RIFCSPHIGHO2_01_FULL_40_24b TaxID=1801739 RepID=A0A1F6V9J1_9BACT|nr:MAG: hypothetical protein A2647_00685 [Candidatus Nomurabacteria bacterium RIFCSPHIGHO2_01_FULL_40_24b]OGI90643.1 MAG: hypothetical protein A3A95_02030 [Candidatus Nomurabacteria bacterium RIFCSPLOWO2_01_FULL_39_18]
MKKILWIAGILILGFIILHVFPKDKFKNLNLDGSIRHENGSNLVSSNILSDPTILAPDISLSKLECKFPLRWQYVNDTTELGSQSFNMWFSAFSNKQIAISSAQSNDGVTWSNVKEGVVKPGSGWDAIGVETASVIKDSQRKYRMYYSSSFKDHDDFAIGVAFSDDGISWKKNEKPIFMPENTWEQGSNNGVMEPSVIYDSNEKIYKMWYSGLGEKDGKPAFRIGYATSLDGISWERLKEPIMDIGRDGEWDDTLVSHVNVAKSQNGYHMFYFGVAEWSDEVTLQKGAIGHAFSSDGIKWQKNPNNPIIKPREDYWDAWTVGGPSAIILNNKIWLWYFGNPQKDTFEGRLGLVKGICE